MKRESATAKEIVASTMKCTIEKNLTVKNLKQNITKMTVDDSAAILKKCSPNAWGLNF